jgi:hypothetical protein
MENVGLFYGHLEYSAAIWYILCPLSKFVVIWYIVSPVWYILTIKIWQPWRGPSKQREAPQSILK